MRINKYVALATGISRRAADAAIAAGQVELNGRKPAAGADVTDTDVVTYNGVALKHHAPLLTIMLNKPAGYIVSRNGQGGRTIYELLPPAYDRLKPVGRLDKDSCGLLLLTNDGNLAQELTHPSRQKTKIYEITLNKPLEPLHRQMISDHGITLDDGVSKLQLDRPIEGDDFHWTIAMHEGRNRQIRRTFESLGYAVTRLHRTHFGPYALHNLESGHTTEV